MLNTLDLHEGMRVLEIGTGTGYNTALLAARLGDDHVFTVEIDPLLAEQARCALLAANCTSTVICGDGAAGWRADAPFDRIIVTASVKLGRVPYSWVEQIVPVPWTTLGNEAPQWAIAVSVPSCRYALWPRTPGRNPHHGVAWLADPLSGSWASVIPSDTESCYDVRQHGSRRLWDEVEAAYRWWLNRGTPTLDQWRFTVSAECQKAELG